MPDYKVDFQATGQGWVTADSLEEAKEIAKKMDDGIQDREYEIEFVYRVTEHVPPKTAPKRYKR